MEFNRKDVATGFKFDSKINLKLLLDLDLQFITLPIYTYHALWETSNPAFKQLMNFV